MAMRHALARMVGPTMRTPPTVPAATEDSRGGSYPLYLAALRTACPMSKLSAPSRVPISKTQVEKTKKRITSSMTGRNKREKPKAVNQTTMARSFSVCEGIEGTEDSERGELGGCEETVSIQRWNRR